MLGLERWFGGGGGKGAKAVPGRNLTAREVAAQGPYTQMFKGFVARQVAPRLYEAMREAIPPIDAAIDRLCTLDGIIRVQGESDALVREITEWAAEVPVNDMQQGLQTFYTGQGNELYEQGFTVGTYELGGGDVTRLRVADSKGVIFTRGTGGRLETWYCPPAQQAGRRDGTDQVERVLRNNYTGAGEILGNLHGNGYVRIAPERVIYASRAPEADNPYGTSLLRSMEFVAKVLLTIDASTLQVWERFGNPVFEVTYKAKSRLDSGELEARRTTLAANLAAVLSIKRQGNSADFVNAIGRDDELTVKVLGAEGEVLEIEQPAKHVLEQIISKSGLPAWILGYHWSTAERLAQRQGEIALQESKTRFEARKPGLTRLVAQMLRARGRTWNAGDWELYQDLPSLQDLVAQAQARFLDAQTQMMLNGSAGATSTDPDTDPPDDAPKMVLRGDGGMDITLPTRRGKGAGGRKEDDGRLVEDDPQLGRVKRRTERALLTAWHGLYRDVLEVLALDDADKAAKAEGPVFIFADGGDLLAALLALGEEFAAADGAAATAQVRGMLDAWQRGTLNGAEELDGEDLTDEAARREVSEAARRDGLELVRNATVRAYQEDVVDALARGLYDGENPRDVARSLRTRFDAHEVDWLRLARTEIVTAQGRGKLAQYAAHGIEEYDYVTAADGQVSEVCRALAAGSPYTVGAGPIPGRDSHPNCRCTVVAV